MSQPINRTTRRSWASRLGNSTKSILFGLALAVMSLLLLFRNEGQAVDRLRSLAQGAGQVVLIDADRPEGHEGRLVHVTGVATPSGRVADPELGVAAWAIHLRREVEMYQWMEERSSVTERKVGGSTETSQTTSYRHGWSEHRIDSDRFTQPAGHHNPPAPAYTSRSFTAPEVNLGKLRLGPGLIGRIAEEVALPVDSLSGLPAELARRSRPHAGGIYVGSNPAAPQVGDLRIRYRVVEPQQVSVVARLTGDQLGPHRTASGGAVELVRTGLVPADEMFAAAVESSRAGTWFVRLFGFLLMIAGLRLAARPFAVAADVLPALGDLARAGIGLFSILVALPATLVTIAIAWIFYRPLVAALVLAIAGGLGILALSWAARSGRRPPATRPAGAPSIAGPA